MGFSVKKAGGNIAATVKNPIAAAKNSTVQKDLLNAGLILNPMTSALGGIRAFNKSKGGGGGGGGGPAAEPYDAWKDPNSMQSIISRGPTNALSGGPQKINDASAWLKMQTDRQKIEEQAALDNAAKQGASGTAAAYNQLAMRGGLSSGARERVAAGGATQQLLNRQNTARQGELARLGLGTEAEKMNMDASRFNADMAFKHQLAQQDLENLKYQEQAKMFASGQTADALKAAAERKSMMEKFGDNAAGGFKSLIGK